MTPQAEGTQAAAVTERSLAEAVAIVERWRLPYGVLVSVVLHGMRAAARDLATAAAPAPIRIADRRPRRRRRR